MRLSYQRFPKTQSDNNRHTLSDVSKHDNNDVLVIMPFQKDQCDPLMTWFKLRNQTGYERSEKDTNFDQEHKSHRCRTH